MEAIKPGDDDIVIVRSAASRPWRIGSVSDLKMRGAAVAQPPHAVCALGPGRWLFGPAVVKFFFCASWLG